MDRSIRRMRYADAVHVDLGGFRTRKPIVGRMYWLIGMALCVMALLLHGSDPVHLRWMTLICVIAWIRAWQQQIGAAWRSPLVASCLISAVGATNWRELALTVQGVWP